MVSRTRVQELDKVTGGLQETFPGGAFTPYLRYNRVEECSDEVAPGDNHGLLVKKWTISGMIANGRKTSGIGAGDYELKNAPIGTFYPPAHMALSGPSDGGYASKLLARTNPSRPVVDLPVFIYELKDLPDLIKIEGDTILKTVSKANLSYHFGWKPLVSDLLKLFDFHAAVNNRYRELKQLYSKGLSRTIELDRLSDSGIWGPGVICHTSGRITITAKVNRVTTQVVRGHVKWKPTALPPSGDQALMNQARRAVLGLYVNPAAVWEAIPFSWLVDWFGDVGNFLNAHRNFVPAEPYHLAIMRETRTSTSYSPDFVSPGVNVQWGSDEYVTKTRSSPSASISAYLPYLTLRQLSILGSLAVIKKR